MHLHTLMGWTGSMTHRQYLAWHEWLKLDFWRPSRTDCYQMRTAMEVARGHARHPNSLRLSHFMLVSKDEQKVATPESIESAARLAKARWVGGLGFAGKEGGIVRRATITPEEAEALKTMHPEEAMRYRRQLASRRDS